MIKNQESLSMVEALELIKKAESENTELKGFIKKFVNVNEKDATRIRQEIEKLNLLKVKLEHIAKIIDLLPETASDLAKIFSDVSLDENETKQILNTLGTPESKAIRAELIYTQENDLDAMDDVVNATAKRDKYFSGLEKDLDKIMTDLSPVELAVIRKLLKTKFKNV